MIIDVHSHVPSHVDDVPREERVWDSKMRPDRAVRLTTTYGDFFKAGSGESHRLHVCLPR